MKATISIKGIYDIFAALAGGDSRVQSFRFADVFEADEIRNLKPNSLLFRHRGSSLEQRDDGAFNSMIHRVSLVFLESRLDDDSNVVMGIADGESVLADMARKFFGADSITSLGIRMAGNIEFQSYPVQYNNGLISVVGEIDVEVPWNACNIAVPIDSFGGGQGGACLPVSIQNTSGATFGQGTSGGIFTIPDITIINGVESGTTAYSGTVYTNFGTGGYANVNVVNSTPNTLSAITAYEGNTYEFEVVDSNIINSNGDAIGAVAATSAYTIGDITITNLANTGETTTVPYSGAVTVNFTGASVSGVIGYLRPQPATTDVIWVTGDTQWHANAGTYDRATGNTITSIPQINYAAIESDIRGTYYGAAGDGSDTIAPTMLKEENAFGNLYRFTDDAGNPSDSTISSEWRHVDFETHSWASATPYYIIDHLTGLGWNSQYLTTSDGKYNMNPTNGKSYDDWLAYVSAIGTFIGYDGWRIPSVEEATASPLGARHREDFEWANNIYVGEATSGTDRFLSLSSHVINASNFTSFADTGNNDLTDEVARATSTAYVHTIMNVFMVRTHFNT